MGVHSLPLSRLGPEAALAPQDKPLLSLRVAPGTTIPRMLLATSGLAIDGGEFEFVFPPLLFLDPTPSPRAAPPPPCTHMHTRTGSGLTYLGCSWRRGRGPGVRLSRSTRRGRCQARSSRGPCLLVTGRSSLHATFSGCISLVLPVPDSTPLSVRLPASALGRPACQVLLALTSQHVPPLPVRTFRSPPSRPAS